MWERLWRRTVTLAREFPALWLPVILADLAGFALWTNKHTAVLFVARLSSRTFSGRSVLSGSIGYGDSVTGISLIAASVVAFVIQLAPIVLYTIAFFATDRMVSRRVGHQSLGEGSRTGKMVFALSIRGLLIGCTIGIAVGLTSFALVRSRWNVVGLPRTIFADVLGGLMTSAFAYLMVPPAMQLLANPAEPPGGRSIRLAIKCAIAAVIASTGLMILERLIIGVIYGARHEIVAILAIESVITSLPYAPLYIALSLLAGNEQSEVVEGALVPEEA